MPTIDWIPISDMQPGDRVKIPRVSSWGFYDSREDTERSQIMFRGIEPEARNASMSPATATLVVRSHDYDGKGKAWVRFDDGTDAIVGGSRVER